MNNICIASINSKYLSINDDKTNEIFLFDKLPKYVMCPLERYMTVTRLYVS